MQPGNTGVSAPGPAGNQEGEGGEQIGNTEDSTSAPAGNQGEGGRQSTKDSDDSSVVPEMYKSELQDNLTTPEPENKCFNSKSMVSKSPATDAQQSQVEGLPKCLQLYNRKVERFSFSHLSNPKTWRDITYARPGWIPDRLPYHEPGERYWELKANSAIVFASMPLSEIGQKKKVPCGVTCYVHFEGPWCEIQSQTRTRICILAAPPPTPRVPLLTWPGPLEQNPQEDVLRGPKPRVPVLRMQAGKRGTKFKRLSEKIMQ